MAAQRPDEDRWGKNARRNSKKERKKNTSAREETRLETKKNENEKGSTVEKKNTQKEIKT